jgi:hypothetical protein
MNVLPINICFVANFYKTYFFHEIAQRLIAENIKVNWIVTKRDQYDFLLKHYPSNHILYINRTYAQKASAPIGDFRLNELVYGDRVFKFSKHEGFNFLQNIQKPVYDFIRGQNIRFIFGEITWAHELLIHRICKKKPELSCTYLDCSLVRIPNNRFAFFSDENQSSLVEFDEPFVPGTVIKLEKPKYLALNDKIVKKNSSLKGRINRIKRFLSGENIEKGDPNVIIHKPVRFMVAGKEELNKVTYRRLRTTDFSDVENENYVFYGFHKQPEASIDVIGRYSENQAQIVINIWRMLPPGWKIVIKEHTNAIGDRSYKFYKQLLSYPGIVLVNEKTDSFKLINKSKLVASVTGTIAYEAALMAKPSITFSKVYFNRLNYCKYTPLHNLIEYDSLTTLINELSASEDNRLEFSNYLLKNSFDGYITDHNTDPAVMDPVNLSKVTTAFIKLVNKYG